MRQLEALAGELVAIRSPGTAKDLENVMERMNKAAARGDEKKFAMLNSEFHSTIVVAAGNETLRGIWEGLNVRSRTRLNMSRSAADLQALAATHQEKIDKNAEGDAVAAREVSWRHERENSPNAAG